MNGDREPPAIRQSPLSGALVRLEPVTPEHAGLLCRLAALVRQERPYLLPDAAADLDAAAEAHFGAFGLVKLAITRGATAQPAGLCMAHDYNSRDRVASLALELLPECRADEAGEAVRLLINYVFANWDLRKLYAYAGRFPVARLPAAAAVFFQEEGCLRAHYSVGAQTWDDTIFAFYRRDLAAFNAAPAAREGAPRATASG